MAENPPAWAQDRADELTGDGNRNAVGYWLAFARYIAANEEPPVDPLVSKLDEICRDACQSYDFCGVGLLKRLEASGLMIVEAEKGKSHAT